MASSPGSLPMDGGEAVESGRAPARVDHDDMEPEEPHAGASRQKASKENRAAYLREWRAKNKDKTAAQDRPPQKEQGKA